MDTIYNSPCLQVRSLPVSNNPAQIEINNVYGDSSYSDILNPDGSHSIFIWTFEPGDTVTIEYSIFIDCNVRPDTSSNNILLQQHWELNADTFEIDLVSGAGNAQDHILTQTPLLPYIISLGQTSITDLNYLATSEVEFRFKNTGFGMADINFLITDSSSCAGYEIDSVYYKIGNSSLYTKQTSLNTPTHDTIPVDSILFIKFIVRSTQCADNCNSFVAHLKWQCYEMGKDFCTICQKNYTVPYQFHPAGMTYEVRRLEPTYGQARFDISCPDSSVAWSYEIRNTSESTYIDSLFVRLNNPAFGPMGMTMIDSSSIILSGYPVDAVIYTVNHSGNTNCLNEISAPLQNCTLVVTNFPPDTAIVFEFSTYKCCEQDSNLYNVEKVYNFWSITSSAYNECGTFTFPTAVADTTYTPTFSLNGISSHKKDGFYDIDLSTELIQDPPVTDLTVPANSTFGESGDFVVNINGLFGNMDDAQLLGHNYSNSELQGLMRVTIVCERGLRIEDLLNHVLFSSDDDTLGILTATTMVNDTICEGGQYQYYFDLSTLGAGWVDFFQSSNSTKFYFTLQSCCTAMTPDADFSVAFDLLLNSNECYDYTASPDTFTCGDCCWLPLAFEEDYINIHCPGCAAPGIIVDEYQLLRRSYGFEDTNDDNIADGSTGITQIDHEYSHFDELKLYNSMYGDSLVDYLVAHFQDGETPPGYLYSEMMSDTAILRVLQLDRRIDHSNFNEVNLEVSGFNFYIDVTDTTGLDCLDCEKFNGVDTSGFKTVLKLCVDITSLSNYLQRTDDQYFYTFIDSILSESDTCFFDANYNFSRFLPNQQYRMKVNYTMCRNFRNEFPTGIQDDDVKLESRIVNQMWLSGMAQDITAWSNVDEKPNSVDSGFQFTQDWADTLLFWCEPHGGSHNFFSNSFYTLAETVHSIGGGTGCNKMLQVRAINRVGHTNFPNIFNYEVRYPSIIPVRWEIKILDGYIPDSVLFYSTPQIHPSKHYLPIDNDTLLIYTLDDLPQDIACHYENEDTILYMTDQIAIHRMDIYMHPDTCVNLHQDTIDSYPSNFTIVTFSSVDGTNNCFGGSVDSLLCGSFSIEEPSKSSLPENAIFSLPDPDVSVQFPVPYQNADSMLLCWNFNLSNYSVGGVTDAPNVYLMVPDTLSYLSNWSATVGITPVPVINHVIQLSDLLLVLPHTEQGLLCATHIKCSSADTVAFDVFWGWNCDGYPYSFDPLNDSLCEINSTTLGFINSEALVGVEIEQDTTTLLCDTLSLSAEFLSQSNSQFCPNIFSITEVPGLNIAGVEITLCSSSLVSSELDSMLTPTSWLVDSASLAQIGITGGCLSGADIISCFQVDVLYTTECSSLDDLTLMPSFSLQSTNYCGDTINSGASGYVKPDITGGICTACFTFEKHAVDDTVIVGNNTTFQLIVCNYNLNTELAIIVDTLPSDFTYVSGDDTIIYLGMPPNTCDTFNIVGYFSTLGDCVDSIHMNKAYLIPSTNILLHDSACVIVIDECEDKSNRVIPDSTYSSTMSDIINDTAYVKGRFYIDDSFTISNSLVYMGPGAQILVDPNIGLALSNSTLTGCDFMWTGIRLGSEATLASESSTIKDADIGLFMEEDAVAELVTTNFIDCVTGIYTEYTGSTNNTSIYVMGCEFGFDATGFKSYYGGQHLHGSISKVGIELNDNIVTIGDDDLTNTFYNLNTGVVAHNSLTTIKNSMFVDISDDGFYNKDYDGTAMVSDSYDGELIAHLIVQSDDGQYNTVESSDRGIYTDASRLTATGITITDVIQGVYGKRHPSETSSKVSECRIYAENSGIYWIDNYSAKNLTAENNYIDINYPADVISFSTIGGIFAGETYDELSVVYKINQNEISIFHAGYGIQVDNISHQEILYNDINISISSNSLVENWGIRLENTHEGTVGCNTVVSAYGQDDNWQTTEGVSISSSQNNTIACNTIDSTDYGFTFEGDCDRTTYKGNEMYGHFRGLELDQTAKIGVQEHHGNNWVGPFADTAAVFDGSPTVPQQIASEFIVDTALASTYFPEHEPLGWFKPGTDSTYSCEDDDFSPCQSGEEEAQSSQGPGMESVANGTYQTPIYNDESITIAEYILYKSLLEDSASWQNDTLYSNFLSDKQSEEIGELYEVRKTIVNAMFVDSASATVIDSVVRKIHLLGIQIADLDSQQFTSISVSNYRSERSQYIDSINLTNQYLSNIRNTRSGVRSIALSQAESLNFNVNANILPNINTKYINSVAFSLLANDYSILRSEYNSILAIAQQCPLSGGQAVFQARVMIALVNDSIMYDDDANCLVPGRSRTIQGSSKTHELTLRPNPAKDLINVQVVGDFNMSGYQLINSIGSVFLERNSVDQNVIDVDVSNLTSGVYFFKAIDEVGFQIVKKFVISK